MYARNLGFPPLGSFQVMKRRLLATTKGVNEGVEPKWRRTAQPKGRCEAGEMLYAEKCVTKFTTDVFLQHLLWRTRLGIWIVCSIVGEHIKSIYGGSHTGGTLY